jgi:hypothetical protein
MGHSTNHGAARATQAALLIVAGLLLSSCRDKEITAYQIPKEAVTESPAQPESAQASPSQAPGIQWTAPSDWQVQPATGMRQGSFLVPGTAGASADVSVVSFPGSGGDDLANVNRWR